MLSFGKSASGRKGLIGRRKFDRLIQAGARIVNDRFDPNENETFMRSLTVRSTLKMSYPRRDGIEVHWAKSDDNDLSFANPPIGGRIVYDDRVSKRKLKQLNMRFGGIIPSWLMPGTDIKKVDRYTEETPRGQVFLETNLDGEEKLERYEIREYNRNRRSNGNFTGPARTWKSSGEKNVRIYIPTSDLETAKLDVKPVKIAGVRFKANKQWATKKPKIHRAWTIGEETSAAFLERDRKATEWHAYVDEMKSRANARMMEQSEIDNEYFEMQEAA